MSTTPEHKGYWRQDLAVYGRHGWLHEPGLWALGIHRFGWWLKGYPPPIRQVLHAAYFVAYSVVRLVTGVDLPRTAVIGPGFRIFHFGGITINPGSTIGARCRVRQGVTIGVRDTGGGVPTIGDDVFIGSYAQILGDIRVGDAAKIGAMACVLTDVPAGATAVGVPARIIEPPEG